MLSSREEVVEHVASAYEHLYDLVYLRTHPLTPILAPNLRPKEQAWQVHHLLLNMISELNPGPQAPVLSREWRRHRLLLLRYADGLDPQAVADRLSISRRHYYREHQSALDAVADILWDRYLAAAHALAPTTDPQVPERIDLLRLEAARIVQPEHPARLDEIMRGVLNLLQNLIRVRRITIEMLLPDETPGISIDRNLLRQILIAALGYLVKCAEGVTLHIGVQPVGDLVIVSLWIKPTTAIENRAPDELQDWYAMVDELASLSAAEVKPIEVGSEIAGFELHLPTSIRHTVLVVDDNSDILELFQRYLSAHHYRVVTAQTVQRAIELTREIQPYAITLDLMMPDQDGWDLLQTLLSRPATRQIPVIVCSVLKQKELALSLGAAAFLEKPISEQALLNVLGGLG